MFFKMFSSSRLKNVNINDAEGVISEKVDLLFEKRKAVREAALNSLHTTLSLRYCGNSLETRKETLADGLERVLRDLQPEPTLLSLRTAALTAISLPSGHTALFKKLNDVLKKIILNESQPTNIKTEALSALAMVCFMSCLFDVDHEMMATSDTLDLLRDRLFSECRDVPPDITNAALQGWMLLASTLSSTTIHENYHAKYFAKACDLMGDACDITLRVSAAKAVAILIEWEKDYRKLDGTDIEEDLGDVLKKMLGVFDDKSKFKSKVDLKKQKSTLKSLIAYVEGDLPEEQTIFIRNLPLVLSTWTQTFRMDCFKAYLGEGFMNHLEENGNLMYIFDYYMDTKVLPMPVMTKKQRRLSLSEASKVATKARCSLRSIREQEMGYATE